ncbi:MAG: phage tail sheath protein [Methylocystaceae bacterium]|nr:MAG: phage tail sheath protein [Methylocystaceae bacterium]KAF0213945.1 MAG: phage tail sheath [Methylocystaceae bacterium]TXT46850.1 MAG: phage tail sheath protein [Methylocystaceae bacterium]
MPATTPNVGVRTFLDRADKAPFLIADMSTIGGVFTPGTGIDRDLFPPDAPVHFTTSDTEMVTAAGTGTLKQLIEACNYSGIVASIVACVPDILVADTADQKMTKMVGDSVAKTGSWAMMAAQGETGVVPDLLIAPDFAHLRPGDAANPIITAFDAICERLITPVAIADTPSANKTVAVEWAADWAETLNVICCGQGARVSEAGLPVTRASAPYIAALMAKTDKRMGGPYFNPGNQPLGILGPSRAVECNYTDPDSEHNWLLQRGVNTIVQLEKNRTSRSVNSPQGKMFWGFFTTSNDPLWRLINVVRTRKAIREVIPRTLVRYLGQNIGTNLVVVLRQSVMDFLGELASLPEPAILPGFDVIWDRDQNSNAVMRVGGLVFNAYWEESPALVDLQLYTGRREQSFDILASEIQAAMAQYNVSGTL